MFLDPKRVVEQFGMTPGMKVADIGSGAGFYAIECARLVGEKGRVYAVDIQQELLTRIKNQARSQHIGNVEVIWGDVEKIGGTRLQEATIDFALVSNVLFQIANKQDFCKELRRILKPTGKLSIIDWSSDSKGLGPRAEDIVSESAARTIFEQAGFTYDHTFAAGEYHYGLMFKR